jgi:hypothetical protein
MSAIVSSILGIMLAPSEAAGVVFAMPTSSRSGVNLAPRLDFQLDSDPAEGH